MQRRPTKFQPSNPYAYPSYEDEEVSPLATPIEERPNEESNCTNIGGHYQHKFASRDQSYQDESQFTQAHDAPTDFASHTDNNN